MTLNEYLRRQFAYDEWANREVIAAIRRNGNVDARTLQLVSHIVAAERLWLERLSQQPQSVKVWPDMDLPGCEAENAALGRLWAEYLDRAGDLSRSISYQNTKGEAWTSTVVDVLTHVVMHSAYHRGQIASHMRETGLVPAYTDFIHGVRQGFIK
jgi:uncharacterized damage-inducible protein DinB